MKGKLRSIVLILVLSVMVLSSVQAEDWETITSGWRPEHILAANDDLWAASEGGLLHVDPATSALEVLNVDDGLFSSFLSCIEFDSSTGYIWIGYENGGLDVFDPVMKKVVQYLSDFYSEQSENTINDIKIDGGEIFIATNQGLSRMMRFGDEELWVVLETYRGFGNWSRPTEITDVTVFGDKVFIGSNLGVAFADLDANMLDVTVWDILSNQDIVPGEETNGIQFIRPLNDELYLSYYLGDLFRWDGVEFDSFANANSVFDLRVADDGTLYAGRGNGLYRMLPGGSQFIRVDDDYTAKFWGLCIHDGEVWGAVDTNLKYFGGIAQWSGSDFDLYYPNTIGGDQILTLATSPTGDIWAAARNSRIPGVYRLSDGQWYPYAEPNSPQAPWGSSIAMNAIEFDEYGGTWIGTWGNSAYHIYPGMDGLDSLYYFDNLNSELAGTSGPTSDYIVVNGFEPDPNGGLWMTNMLAYDDSSLVYVPESWFVLDPEDRDMNSWVRYGPQQGFDFPSASLIEMDSQGRLWIASLSASGEYQLVILDPMDTPMDPSDDEHLYISETGIEGFTHVNAMSMGDDDILWLGSPVGLSYVDTRTVVANEDTDQDDVLFTRVHGALGQSISALTIDPLNQIWVGTDFGLSVLGRDRFTWIKQYTTEDGPAPSGLADNQVTALTVDPKTGDVYIGTPKGLSVVTSPYRDFADDLGTIEFAPQPFVIGTPGVRLRFGSTSLVADAEINIFSTSGRLIRTLGFQTASADGWNGRDEDGEWVGSGVYYVVVTGPGGSSNTGKVAVVRE